MLDNPRDSSMVSVCLHRESAQPVSSRSLGTPGPTTALRPRPSLCPELRRRADGRGLFLPFTSIAISGDAAGDAAPPHSGLCVRRALSESWAAQAWAAQAICCFQTLRVSTRIIALCYSYVSNLKAGPASLRRALLAVIYLHRPAAARLHLVLILLPFRLMLRSSRSAPSCIPPLLSRPSANPCLSLILFSDAIP